jgi:hypothetical protein
MTSALRAEVAGLPVFCSRYPPPPRSIGIMGLGENRGEIYVAQYFTGKIFEPLGLRVTGTSRYFSGEPCKILNLQELLTRTPFSGLQNIDFAGLARKILQNIDLAYLGTTLTEDSCPPVAMSCVFSDRNPQNIDFKELRWWRSRFACAKS